MPIPLILIALTGATAFGTATYANRKAFEDPELKPRAWKDSEMDARPLAGGLGLLGMLFGPWWLAAIGGGLAAGALTSYTATEDVKKGLEPIVAKLMLERSGQPSPPQIPGPGPSSAPPERRPKWLEKLTAPT